MMATNLQYANRHGEKRLTSGAERVDARMWGEEPGKDHDDDAVMEKVRFKL